jgi:hypothetical protein
MIASSPENYNHLQIFLSRNVMSNCLQDNEYLMISTNVFGEVTVLDLRVDADYVTIEFLNIAMQEVGNVRVEINDKNLKVLFVNWNDIKKMVVDDDATNCSDDGLLEFDF